MKKVLYASLLGAALIVQPVSDSDSYIASRPDEAATSAAAALSHYARAERFITDNASAVFDRVFSPANPRTAASKPHVATVDYSVHLAENAYARSISRQYESPTPEAVITRVDVSHETSASEPTHWLLLPAALLLMGSIIRRRTALR